MKNLYKYAFWVLTFFLLTLISCDVSQVDERNKDEKLLTSLSKYEIALDKTIEDLKKVADWGKVISTRKNGYNSMLSFKALDKKVKNNLTPLLIASENLLMNSKFKSSTISRLNSKAKIMLAAIIKAYQKQFKINPSYFNDDSSIRTPCTTKCLGGNLLISDVSNMKIAADIPVREIWECALSAIGVKALGELISAKGLSSYAARKALIKAVGKAAAKAGLGFIGVAIAVGEFAWCLSK